MITQERKENLYNAMKKLEAYRLIQNQMGRAVAAFNFHRAEALMEYFAINNPDVSVEYADEGVFEGPEAVRAIINEVVGAPAKVGEMVDMHLTTPMIEIADDLKTAKCLWWMPGAGSLPQEDGDPMAIWAWGQVSVDFIYEDGIWKIWHLHYFRLIKCDYKKGWVDDISMVNRLNTPLHPLSKACTYHNPYTPTSVRDGLPCAPRPYATYTDADKNWELNRNKDW